MEKTRIGLIILLLVLTACVKDTPIVPPATQTQQTVTPIILTKVPTPTHTTVSSTTEILPENPCDPNTDFAKFSNDDFGVTIEYPESWFIDSYEIGEWVGTGNPGPENILAMATLRGNFSLQSSLDGELVRVFVVRGERLEKSLDEILTEIAARNVESGIDLAIDGEMVIINGLPGIALTISSENEGWISQEILINSSTYGYVLSGHVWPGVEQQNCMDLARRVQNSFMVINDSE